VAITARSNSDPESIHQRRGGVDGIGITNPLTVTIPLAATGSLALDFLSPRSSTIPLAATGSLTVT
jgi:hypothetical protein